jgi:DNA-binding CsgD family transcriptional regulator
METYLTCDSHMLSGCERCVLHLFGPCLQHIDDLECQFSEIQPIFMQLKRALEQGGVIGLTSNGEVQFMTQRAANLIQAYFPNSLPNTIPELIRKKLKHQLHLVQIDSQDLSLEPLIRVEHQSRELLVHLLQEPNQKSRFLLLEEKDTDIFSVKALELLGLTGREAEVLFWVAEDKSNAAIARTIGCCEGTVRKHLENIYKKLDVQTRIGAVMIALRRLGLLRKENVENF